jgi:hypothetical protein
MNYNYGETNSVNKPYRVPVWVWIIAVIGLLFSVNGGYQSGALAADIISYLRVQDTTKDSTALGKLDFVDCIEEHKTEAKLCDLDYSGLFALSYQAKVNDQREMTFNNDYTDKDSVSIDVSVMSMTYYDVRYVNMNTADNGKLNYSATAILDLGNMEFALLEIDRNYTCTVKDGVRAIKAECISVIDRGSGTVSGEAELESDKIYVIVVGAENATGRYTIDVRTSANGGDTEL